MSTTRILGIAPYEGMRNLMIQLAADMDDVALTAFVGDLEPGARIAERYTDKDIDVILSRGGTAELIRQKTHLPVVEIELSMYDILRSIRLAENSNSRYAVVGFPAITRNAFFLCDVLRYDVDIYTIHNEEEARATLQQLARESCPMVLCDMVTNSLAHEYGIPALLITSGSESVEAALRQAVSISRIFLPQREHAHMLEAVLTSGPSDAIILDEAGNEVFSTLTTPLPASVATRLQACHQVTQEEGAKRMTVSTREKQYILTGQKITAGSRCYSAISMHASSSRPSLEKHGVRFLNKEEVMEHFRNNFYGATQLSAGQNYDLYAASNAPLMLLGEPGTGAEQIARLIYTRSPLQHAPICVVDCALLQKKGWDYLMTSDSSPLTDIGVTVLFTHADALAEEWFMQLFRTIRDTGFKQRNRLMFSATLQPGEGLSLRLQQLIDWFTCIPVELPALRSHKEDIPHLASLYISLLNMRNTREIAGMEPEALTLLEAYDWPSNYDQFKRVLQELVLLTDTPYISQANVRRILQREERMYPAQSQGQLADVLRGKTLEEIDRLALKLALAEENGNQRATAARLGISRTTLWRMMQKENLSDVPEN